MISLQRVSRSRQRRNMKKTNHFCDRADLPVTQAYRRGDIQRDKTYRAACNAAIMFGMVIGMLGPWSAPSEAAGVVMILVGMALTLAGFMGRLRHG